MNCFNRGPSLLDTVNNLENFLYEAQYIRDKVHDGILGREKAKDWLMAHKDLIMDVRGTWTYATVRGFVKDKIISKKEFINFYKGR